MYSKSAFSASKLLAINEGCQKSRWSHVVQALFLCGEIEMIRSAQLNSITTLQ